MKILIHEPDLIHRRGFNGFFAYFLSALIRHKGAHPTDAPRPLPRVMKPREHESAWIQADGHLVFFDMSDHVFFYDIEALKRCDAYFKANLNWSVTDRVLTASGMVEHRPKIVPFMFFADQLDRYPRQRAWNALWRGRRRRHDVCAITGVYMNPVHDGEPSIFRDPSAPITPANYHFWIRHQCHQALQQAGVTGYFRLTSRANRALEDHVTVFPNLSQRAFARHIFDASATLVNTLPHAVLPWKATESLAMGRPLILDTAPRIEMPPPFALKPGVHFLELFPGLDGFAPEAPLDDPRSYRCLSRIPAETFTARAQWLRDRLRDRALIDSLTETANRYATTILRKDVVADYICDTIRHLVH